MTDTEINIAIAEACGWTDIKTRRGKAGSKRILGRKAGFTFKYPRAIPHFVTDLNAMHEAEKTLRPDQVGDYESTLYRVVYALPTQGLELFWSQHQTYRLVHATAPQRAEAFLRTLGKWKD